MTPALVLLVALAAGDSVVTFRSIPAEIVRIRAYEWREGRAPAELAAAIDRQEDVVSIRGKPGANVIAMFLRQDDEYMVDGPFTWPAADAERMLDKRWRRSIRVDTPVAVPDGTPVEWLEASGDGGLWPRCVRGSGRVTCWGVVDGESGIAFYRSQEQIEWAVVSTGASRFRSAGWGRLLIGPSGRGLRARLQYPVTPAQRARSVRLETADVAGATSVPVGASAIWVAGREVPEGSWIEVHGPGAGPVYLPLRELADGLASLPVQIVLPDSRVLDGAVFGRGDAPAGGATVTLFRAIETPPMAIRDRDPPRRVFVAETTADRRGVFRLEALGDVDYEIVAWHPQLGRASVMLGQIDGRLDIHLQSPGAIQGRVVINGKPVEGVDVIGVPDPEAARSATDLLDLKGGDARTGGDGRFVVFLASAGGELRIGGGRHPVRRIPLPRGTPASLDLGDIDLGAAIAISVVLNDDPDCTVRAAGPVGRTGLQIMVGIKTAPGLHDLLIPEPGFWEFSLLCGERERALSPGVMEIGPALAGKEVRFLVR